MVSESQPLLHIVFLRPAGMLLTKKPYASWREIQDEYENYVTSLGPWDVDSVLDFIHMEYLSDPPFTEEQVRAFLRSSEMVLSDAECR